MKTLVGKIISSIKFLTILLVLATVIIMILEIDNTAELEKVIDRQTKKYMDDVSLQVTELIEHRLYKISEGMEAVSDSLTYFDIEESELEDFLERKARIFNFTEFSIVNLEGNVEWQSGNTVNFSQTPAFKSALEGEETVFSWNSEKCLVHMAPIYKDGEVDSILAGIKTSEKLYELLEGPSFDNQGNFFIIDQEGTLIAESQSDDFDTEWNSFISGIKKGKPKGWREQMVYDLKNKGHGTVTFHMDEEEYILSYYPIGEYRWFLVTVIPSNVIAEDMDHFIERTIAISVMTVAMLGIIMLTFVMIQQRQQRRLEESQNRYRMAVESPLDPLVEYDSDSHRFICHNRQREENRQTVIVFEYDIDKDELIFTESFWRQFSFDIEHVNNKVSLSETGIVHDEDKGVIKIVLEKACEGTELVKGKVRLLGAGKQYEWYEVYAHILSDNKKKLGARRRYIVGKFININDLKEEASLWQEKANRDGLTGLYNRNTFKEYVKHTLENENEEEGAMIFIDIDNFKWINDNLGHAVGDQVLKTVSHRFQMQFRDADMAARYGGDEFVVFLRNIKSREILKRKLEELRNVFKNAHEDPEISSRVSGSIGAALYPQDGKNYQELVEKADLALYQAKRRGKDQYALYEELGEEYFIDKATGS